MRSRSSGNMNTNYSFNSMFSSTNWITAETWAFLWYQNRLHTWLRAMFMQLVPNVRMPLGRTETPSSSRKRSSTFFENLEENQRYCLWHNKHWLGARSMRMVSSSLSGLSWFVIFRCDLGSKNGPKIDPTSVKKSIDCKKAAFKNTL